MTTTPPRPLDITAVFPALAPHARTAVRLHPAPAHPAVPGPHESSIGGPLAWPSAEPHPTCPGGRHLFAEEHPGPSPLLPVLQVHARDVPWYDGFPEGTDVLQLLWCPFQHAYDTPGAPYNGIAGPWVRLLHRCAADLDGSLPLPPTDAEGHDYRPVPCSLRPEPVTEYPHPGLLGEEFEERVDAWQQATFPEPDAQNDPDDPDDDPEYESRYHWDLSTAPGWKLGGHEPWNYQGYFGPVRCHTCDTPMRFVAALASAEFDGGTASWAPAPDGVRAPQCPTTVRLGGFETMRVFACPRSPDHPVHSDLV
ncbi:hypothetical protein [Kitasatospora sp. NPDC101183]|uniref:hypothetical protein n=1 Tax=Kitasatospora sp. NPDC101183 TaxID=3364100 RepID=UPI003817D415